MSKKTSKAISTLLILTLMMILMAACTEDKELNSDAETLIAQIEDVSPSDWFYRYVVAGFRYGLITADEIENLRFEPERDVTQGEFITMLGRLHEYGHGAIGMPDDGPVYERYVEWALERGIIHRYRYWELMPRAPITREQKAVIVHRYIEAYDFWDYLLHDQMLTMAYFWDADEMSYWAQGPVERLRLRLLVFGGYRQYFKPHIPANRAVAIAILSGVGSAVYDLVHPLRRY